MIVSELGFKPGATKYFVLRKSRMKQKVSAQIFQRC